MVNLTGNTKCIFCYLYPKYEMKVLFVMNINMNITVYRSVYLYLYNKNLLARIFDEINKTF